MRVENRQCWPRQRSITGQNLTLNSPRQNFNHVTISIVGRTTQDACSIEVTHVGDVVVRDQEQSSSMMLKDGSLENFSPLSNTKS